MSGFIANAPESTPDDDLLENDGWFPDLSLTAIRNGTRLDGTVTEDRLRDAARYAISTINDQLTAFKALHTEAGAANLAEVNAAAIDGENRLVLLYRRAVVCTLKADLIERYRDLDTTDAGLRRASEMDPAVGEQRRNASWALRDIQGQPRTTVELI